MIGLLGIQHEKRAAAEAKCVELAERNARLVEEGRSRPDKSTIATPVGPAFEDSALIGECERIDPGLARLFRYASLLWGAFTARLQTGGGSAPGNLLKGVKYKKIQGIRELCMEIYACSPRAMKILSKGLHLPDAQTSERWTVKCRASLGIKKDMLLDPTVENISTLARIAGVQKGQVVNAIMASDHTSIMTSFSVSARDGTQAVGDLSPQHTTAAQRQAALDDPVQFCDIYHTRTMARGVYALIVNLKKGGSFPVALKFTRTCAMTPDLAKWQDEVIANCAAAGIVIQKGDTAHDADRFYYLPLRVMIEKLISEIMTMIRE
jgi:hypothetical protein